MSDLARTGEEDSMRSHDISDSPNKAKKSRVWGKVAAVLIVLVTGICSIAVPMFWDLIFPDVCLIKLPLDNTWLQFDQLDDPEAFDAAGANQPIVRIWKQGKVDVELPLYYSFSSKVRISFDWIPDYGGKPAIEMTEMTESGQVFERYLYVMGDANASGVINWKGSSFLVPITDRDILSSSITGVTKDGQPVSNGPELQPALPGFMQLKRERLGTVLREGWHLVTRK